MTLFNKISARNENHKAQLLNLLQSTNSIFKSVLQNDTIYY